MDPGCGHNQHLGGRQTEESANPALGQVQIVYRLFDAEHLALVRPRRDRVDGSEDVRLHGGGGAGRRGNGRGRGQRTSRPSGDAPQSGPLRVVAPRDGEVLPPRQGTRIDKKRVALVEGIIGAGVAKVEERAVLRVHQRIPGGGYADRRVVGIHAGPELDHRAVLHIGQGSHRRTDRGQRQFPAGCAVRSGKLLHIAGGSQRLHRSQRRQ